MAGEQLLAERALAEERKQDIINNRRAMSAAKEVAWQQFCAERSLPDDMTDGHAQLCRLAFNKGWEALATIMTEALKMTAEAIEEG